MIDIIQRAFTLQAEKRNRSSIDLMKQTTSVSRVYDECSQENRMPHIQLLARANFQSLRGKAINKNSSAGHRDCPARLTRYSRIGSSDLGVAVPLMVAIENMKSCVIPGAET